ncbi:MAG: response regulator [Bacteroidales bacterium]
MGYKQGMEQGPQLQVKAAQELNFRGEHLLVVEDNDHNYFYLEVVFEPYNLRLTRAATGSKALQMLKSGERFDLVVLDIRIPEMDGWEVLRQLRISHPTLPVMGHTAYAFETDRKRGLELGMNAFLTKPARPRDLVETVHELLMTHKI